MFFPPVLLARYAADLDLVVRRREELRPVVIMQLAVKLVAGLIN